MNAMTTNRRLRACPRVAAAAAALLASISCGPEPDQPRFLCGSGAGDFCPKGSMCPEVPLGAGGCEDFPGLFGHPKVTVQTGRPVGCVLLLPYENPYYPGSPQDCSCEKDDLTGNLPRWLCGL